jgi:hypothetical protein
MDARFRLHVTAGLAALSISTAISVPAASPVAASPVEFESVALAAQTHSLSPPTGLIGQQVAFHVTFVTDFLSTGARLFARELPIPLVLAADIGSGTPLPTAVSRALQDLAVVEIDAGNELLRFGAEYVGFQAQFVTGLITGQPAVAPTARPTPRSVVTPAPHLPTPASVARTHRSGPRHSAPRPVSAGSVTALSSNGPGENDSHGPRQRADRHSDQGSSSMSGHSGTQKDGHDQRDRHGRNDSHREHHD